MLWCFQIGLPNASRSCAYRNAERGPGHLEVREGAQQLVEQHPRLHPRQVRAQAHVRAEAERDVRPFRPAQDVEPVRVGPDVLVTVRAGVQHRDVVAAAISCPRIWVSARAVRQKASTGLVTRSISSTAFGSRAGSSMSSQR